METRSECILPTQSAGKRFVQVTIGFVLSSEWQGGAFLFSSKSSTKKEQTQTNCVFAKLRLLRFVPVGHVILPRSFIGSFDHWVCCDWLEMIVATSLFNHAFVWWVKASTSNGIFWCFDLGRNFLSLTIAFIMQLAKPRLSFAQTWLSCLFLLSFFFSM